MTATLTFNLPEDQELFQDAIHGTELADYLQELDSSLRGWLKHGHQFASVEEALSAIRDDLNAEVGRLIYDT